jgi:hypothetical protein
MKLGMRRFAAGLVWIVVGGSPALAQGILGPGRCIGCHDHQEQTRKWQADEPARLGNRAHFTAMGRLDDARARDFAKAIGLPSPYSSEGACVRCHATVFRGRANAGVSCESCHGPSARWIELHQEKDASDRSVAAGLTALKGRVEAVARLCVSCHAVEDARLVAAGHPSGADFDAGRGLREIVHWAAPYDYARVSAAARAATPRLPSTARLPARPSGTPSIHAPGATGAPEAGPVPPPGQWEAARPLPQDYAPEPTPQAAAEERPAPAARASAPSAAGPSIAEEAPLPESPRLRLLGQGEPTTSHDLLAARGRALVLLVRLLGTEVRLPGDAPPTPGEYAGPDGELWRLQDEAYALVFEALRKPQ